MIYDDNDLLYFIEDRLRDNVSGIKYLSNRWNFKCPVCGDSAKNTRNTRGNYYPSTGIYHCFNGDCPANDKSWSGLKLIAYLEDCEIGELKKEFIMDFVKNKKVVDHTPMVKTVTIKKLSKELDIKSTWTSEIPPQYNSIIENRKIYDAPFLPKQFKLYFDKEEGRIIIPWKRYGKMFAYQSMAVKTGQIPKYKFDTDGMKDIYNFDMVDAELGNVFAIEGCFDTIFTKNGITIGGTSLSEHQKDILDDVGCNLVYMFDNQWQDETSYKKTLSMIRAGHTVWIWPNNITQKDQNEFIMERGFNPFENYEWLCKHIHKGIKALAMLKHGGVEDNTIEIKNK